LFKNGAQHSKFGQGKSKYNLNKIMAKLASTSESWIATIFFVMNIIKLAKEHWFVFFYQLFFIFSFRVNFRNQNQNIILLKL
jgi:hypothetical protein